MNRLIFAVFLHTIAATAFLAAYAWQALTLSGRAGGAPLALAASSFTTLCLGPVIGVLVDRLGPSRAYRYSQLAVAGVMLLFIAVRYFVSDSLPLLIAWGVGVFGAAAMSHPSTQGIAQAFSTRETATVVASRTGVGVALGFVVGYSGGGFVVDHYGLTPLLAACAALSIVARSVMPRMADSAAPAPKPPLSTTRSSEFWAGLRYLWTQDSLRNTAVAFVLCYSVFHTVTALLPSFSKFVLHNDASGFGLLRGAWSIGSALGSLLITLLWGNRRLRPPTKLAVIALLGVGLATFSLTRAYVVSILTIGCVGAVHSMCRALLDGAVLEICEPSKIGRVRSNIGSLLSAVSLVVFGAASFVSAEWLPTALAAMGLVISGACLLIYWSERSADVAPSLES